ncbi:hypothetical protein PP175_05375 [Aneurinibacillus sp. Ricciae_BoGa-3]|uniref:hypothetical protein n=1 Tax=Aneurinibacillus sp. Ricciae_BoGa-3 TaxID=3022697 RepID=UPI002340A191|nr:hypothetical protein [Aneurinibacillus sp. Ricciae_BoGa-3]WCK55383.1 hypothetical protein PP175_05375 [Aneurinibacillus sp. Ricciae_BoGa-3]
MKLSKLYSNLDDLFQPINFKDSINIVLAEVRNPQNQTKSTHDLGKSLLASLIDYCLLKEAKKGQFIRDNYKKFELFIFFLEIQLPDGRFCTIRRAVKSREKVMIKVHEVGKRNYKELPKSEWDFQGGLKNPYST